MWGSELNFALLKADVQSSRPASINEGSAHRAWDLASAEPLRETTKRTLSVNARSLRQSKLQLRGPSARFASLGMTAHFYISGDAL